METNKMETSSGCSGGCKCQQKAYGLCGGCGTPSKRADTLELSQKEVDFVKQLESHCYLPVVQFVVQDTTDPMFKVIGFSPVYLEDGTASIEEMREMGKMLVDLQKKKILTLDYHLPLQGYGYEEYLQSEMFLGFAKSVDEEMQGEEHTGVYATIQKGSMALTQAYVQTIDFMEKE